MDYEFKLPDLGENIDSGDIVSVMVSEGDEIEANQAVVEIETDKAVVEVPCPKGGRVETIHVSQGDTISVGSPVLTLSVGDSDGGKKEAKEEEPEEAEEDTEEETESESEDTSGDDEQDESEEEQEEKPKKKKKSSAETKAKSDSKKPAKSKAESEPAEEDSDDAEDDTAPAGPATRRLARELGVDLSRVKGTGSSGRITRDDVIKAVRDLNASIGEAPERAKSPAPAAKAAPAQEAAASGEGDKDSYGPIRREKMSKIRRTIATNMARSASTIPHVTNFDDADITELEHIRRDSSNEFSHPTVKLTMMAFVMKAVAHSLRQHPMINASIDMESEEVIYKDYVNLGVAVDTDRGLVVPVVRDVDTLSIPTIAKKIMDVAARARKSQFSIDELRGGTFTISNMGAVGGQYSTPIINHPEVAVLLVGRSRKVPVYMGENLVPRLHMPLSLSYDHRLVDGATAARFLNEVINFLQTPGRLLLAT